MWALVVPSLRAALVATGLFALASLGACGGASADVSVPSAPTTAEPRPQPGAEPGAPREMPPKRGGLDEKLGAPCEPLAPATCGRDGRVAVVRHVQYDARLAPKLRRVRSHDGRGGPTAHTFDRAVALEGSRLWIVSTCLMCRVQSDLLTIVDLGSATQAQLLEAQRELGLDAREPLATEADWAKTIAALVE